MTIYDIAREAGVSASTVSRVINDKPGVNPATRERIRALLAQRHYAPNEAARGLVTHSSRMVGVLVADIRNQHHIEGAYYIADELAKLGYCALVLNTGNSDEQRAEGIRLLQTRKVEAAVLMGSIFATDAVRDAIARSLPSVPVFMLNGDIELPNVYAVLSDDRAGTAACVELLVRQGRRHVAYLVDQPTPSSLLKTQGYLDGAARFGLEPLVVRGVEGSRDGGFAAMTRLLQEHPEVDGVACSLDIVACGALRAIQDSGRRVPQDVAVVGTDNSVYCEICTPMLTSLDTRVFQSGVMIAHQLVDCLEGRGVSRRTMLFPGIVQRETT
ncbi:MAG: LacI family DNA-binding transcriptional regulator [Candidatus Ventricola sp.]